jgi:hypothetical protein
MRRLVITAALLVGLLVPASVTPPEALACVIYVDGQHRPCPDGMPLHGQFLPMLRVMPTQKPVPPAPTVEAPETEQQAGDVADSSAP